MADNFHEYSNGFSLIVKHRKSSAGDEPESLKISEAEDECTGNESEHVETRCGLGTCRPGLLQRCNTPPVLLSCLCVYTLVHGFAVNGINNVNTTSYERRFDLPSSSVGWISSVYDISAAICGVVIGFYGNRRKKGRILTVAFIMSSVGSLCMWLPHFLTKTYEWGQGQSHLCSGTEHSNICTETDGTLSRFLTMLLFGQLMHGVGGSTLITVGYSFIDDSVTAATSPVYISMIGLCQMLGPMVGFLVGGMLLDVYVDFERVSQPDWELTPTDPRWVGAWWVGFFISSILMFIFALPFCLFGAELPRQDTADNKNEETMFTVRDKQDGQDTTDIENKEPMDTLRDESDGQDTTDIENKKPMDTLRDESGGHDTADIENEKTMATVKDKQAAKHVRETRISETHNSGETPIHVRAGESISFRQFPSVLCRLLRNPAFMCVAFAGAFVGLVSVAMGTFLPKYIQNIYGTTASAAATYAGLLVIPGAALGQMFGGFVIRHWKMKVQTILKFLVAVVALAMISKACFFINCDIVVWNTNITDSEPVTSVTFEGCSQGCKCDDSVYQVVCDTEGRKYYSPCLAGCQKEISNKMYSDCHCVSSKTNVTSVTMENCVPSTCYSLLYIFLFMIFLSAFFVSSSTVPALTVVLRCAHENERTFALGLLNFIARVVGTIPGPILYGSMIDSTCEKWGRKCGYNTSCWKYDNPKMGEYLALLGMLFTGVAICFFTLAYKLYKPPVCQKDTVIEKEISEANDLETPVGLCTLPSTDCTEDTRL